MNSTSESEKSGFYIQIYDDRKRLIEESDQLTLVLEGVVVDATVVITPSPDNAIAIEDCETVDESFEYSVASN